MSGALDPLLHFKIETEPHFRSSVGKGTLLYFGGWCFHEKLSVQGFRVEMDDRVLKLAHPRLPRYDLIEEQGPSTLAEAREISQAGFDGMVSVTQSSHLGIFRLSAELEGGEVRTLFEASALNEADENPVGTSSQPAVQAWGVAICLATYNPDLSALRVQLNSLLAQTYQDWHCYIRDDHSEAELFEQIQALVAQDPLRFTLVRGTRNLGFYRNFEQCLGLVPRNATYIALCDQDDFWYPEKLAQLVQGFGPHTKLVYSDMRIVKSEGGEVVSPTYWRGRSNNYTRLDLMIQVNTITGAASMFRRELLDEVLPFPDFIPILFHDHWIACVALAAGEVKYLDQPLYDYIQHSRNIIGHSLPEVQASNFWAKLFSLHGWAQKFVQHLKRRCTSYLHQNRRVQLFVRLLELRVPSSHMDELRKLKSLTDESFGGQLRLWLIAVSPGLHVNRRDEISLALNGLLRWANTHLNAVLLVPFLRWTRKASKTSVKPL